MSDTEKYDGAYIANGTVYTKDGQSFGEYVTRVWFMFMQFFAVFIFSFIFTYDYAIVYSITGVLCACALWDAVETTLQWRASVKFLAAHPDFTVDDMDEHIRGGQ